MGRIFLNCWALIDTNVLKLCLYKVLASIRSAGWCQNAHFFVTPIWPSFWHLCHASRAARSGGDDGVDWEWGYQPAQPSLPFFVLVSASGGTFFLPSCHRPADGVSFFLWNGRLRVLCIYAMIVTAVLYTASWYNLFLSDIKINSRPVSYTHLTLPTNREV